MDREKVIKELEYEVKRTHREEYDFVYLNPDLADKVLALLKEQEEEIENLKQTCQSMMEGVCLLKEQEAKTGYWIDSAGNDKCSICGTEYSDLYPDYSNTHFCPNCGAKMEGR